DDEYDLYAQRQTKSQVDKLLWQLPDNQRAALLLFHQQGFSTREVAAILGLGERAAESLLVRARRALRQSYKEQIDDKE
ncbi:MAG: sigma factor-like helix-turn-helix DNA-binding protein, partial [Pseudomonadota bacterium]|nr:sigma factor-like helix-turn-helix DNA-binding protein [Pseudomonadota bacterium]